MKKRKNYLTILLIIFVASLNAQIVNEGLLKIKDGTTVYFGETYTNKIGATHDNEGNLHLNGDLINNGTMVASANPDLANGITYFDSPTNINSTVNTVQNISGTNKVVMENMVINMTNASSKGVLVSDGLEVLVENGLTLTNGDLRLTGGAQLIQKHTGANANLGNASLLKDQQGTNDVYNYNYWSSPVSGATANQYQIQEILFDGTDATLNPFSPQQITYSTGSPWNGSSAVVDGSGNVVTPSVLESYWIWKFENQPINDLNGWVLLRENTAINAGLGFTHKGTGTVSTEQNYVFKGKPNDGSYTFAIGAGNSTMLGNPYPSAIDANKFINDNAAVLADVIVPSATTGAIYYWEHWGGGSHFQSDYQGGYATYTLAGGTPASSHPLVNGGGTSSGINGQRYIPVGQGFFVESIIGGTITIDNSQRLFKLEGVDSNFFRHSKNEDSNDITDTTPRIRLKYVNPNGFNRQIMTAFIPETHDRHDIGYDAKMADLNPDDMYWDNNFIPYVIDARPFGIEKQIPITIEATTEGYHKIYLEATENFLENVYILDTQTGYTTNIRNEEFKVYLSPNTHKDRFKLVFQPQSPLDVSEEITNDLSVYFQENNASVIIDNSKNITIKNIKIYNSIGQLIKEISNENTLNTTKVQIPFEVAAGTYFVSVITNKGKGGFKIIAY